MNMHRRKLALSKGFGATTYSPIAQALSTLPYNMTRRILGSSSRLHILSPLKSLCLQNIPNFVTMNYSWSFGVIQAARMRKFMPGLASCATSATSDEDETETLT